MISMKSLYPAKLCKSALSYTSRAFTKEAFLCSTAHRDIHKWQHMLAVHESATLLNLVDSNSCCLEETSEERFNHYTTHQVPYFHNQAHTVSGKDQSE